MTSTYTHRYVLRATVEFATPFLVGSGRKGDIADAVFVADANGLPALPGSSIAGVLRARFSEAFGEQDANTLFGYQLGENGEGSRLSVSWGCIHDGKNTPVEGIVSSERLDDPALAKARTPVIRDHVRINHKGASDAEEHGKFDEEAVCAGHRFTFELELGGDEQQKNLWDKLLRLLASSSLRFGGKTRRGYGACRFVALKGRVFDLRADFDAYASHPVSLAAPTPALEKISLPELSPDESIELTLAPRGFWMFGGGYDLPEEQGDADMSPVRDSRIVWKDDTANIENDLLVVPATAVKGALAHRTAFHYNAIKGIFADNTAPSDLASLCGEGNVAVRELFGYCKGKLAEDAAENDAANREEGRPGKVFMDDLYLPSKHESQFVHHVGIDRFTGGARDQVLFNERPLWKGEPLRLRIRLAGTGGIHDRADVLKAFRAAVEDLAEGRLQVGAGNGRGLGYFDAEAPVRWPADIRSAIEG